MIDYRALLLKYMQLIVRHEGISYIGEAEKECRAGYWTPEEVAALRQIDAEVFQDAHE